jgi:hypothetical protein
LKEAVQSVELKGIPDDVKELGKAKEEANKYSGGLKDLKESGIRDIKTEKLEEETMKMGEVKEVKAQSEKFNELQAKEAALLQQYSDKKLIQEELKRKTAYVANDQLSKFMPTIKTNQADFTKAKKPYSNSNAIADSVKRQRPVNAMSGKPLMTRIIPGLHKWISSTEEYLQNEIEGRD